MHEFEVSFAVCRWPLYPFPLITNIHLWLIVLMEQLTYCGIVNCIVTLCDTLAIQGNIWLKIESHFFTLSLSLSVSASILTNLCHSPPRAFFNNTPPMIHLIICLSLFGRLFFIFLSRSALWSCIPHPNTLTYISELMTYIHIRGLPSLTAATSLSSTLLYLSVSVSHPHSLSRVVVVVVIQ